MPETFNWNDFSAGWCPSDDAINGRKNALLQMDNLELDKNGSLSLSGGTAVVGSAYAHNAHTLYSNIISGTRHDYLADTSGGIFRDGSSIGTGGDSSNAAFGVAFNFTLAASGNTRIKDNGTTAVNLGVGANVEGIAAVVVDGWYVCANSVNSSTAYTPTLGGVVSGGDPTIGSGPLLGAWVLTAAAGYADGLTAVGQTITLVSSTVDTTTFQSQGQLGGDPSPPLPGAPNYSGVSPNDVVYFQNLASNTSFVKSITLDFLLEAGDSTADVVSDYFTQTWINDGQSNPVLSIPFIRGDGITTGFIRVGSGNQGWNAVKGFRVTVAFLPNTPPSSAGIIFIPTFIFYGALHSLNGTYQFAQLNVNNTGSYLAKSVLGLSTNNATLTFNNQLVKITPFAPATDDAQANEAWIFARGGTLDQWYRIMVFNATTGFTTPTWSSLSDLDMLDLDITINLNLVSIASSGITDKIFDVVGPMEGRWFYFTTNFIYPSDINDPDLVDVSLAVRSTGANSEIFLWARRVANQAVLVGTSRDVYLLTGTFVTLPDGTVDIYYQSLGCKYPPISYDATFSEGFVMYLSANGWRSIDTNGSNPSLVNTNTDRLYRGITAYGYSVNTQVIAGSTRFPCVLALNRLWCGITGQARIEVLDTIRTYWRSFAIGKGDCTAVCSTQDGKILAFFASDKKLRTLDVQSSLEIDGATTQTIHILSPVFDGGTPKQRHEFYTIKLRLATGSAETLSVRILDDSGNTTTIGTVTSNGAVTQQTLDLSASFTTNLPKFWQFVLTGSFSAFTLDDVEIDFDVRPIQLTHLHLLPDNYGTTGRKRIPTLPFVIDCLGNNVTYTPIVDGSAQTGKVVATTRKQSVDYEFTADVPGVDWEYTIDGGGSLFEFFGNLPAQYIEKLPEPATYHKVPVSNLGSPNKKRVRVWPLILDTLSNNVTLTPIVDGSATTATVFNGSKQTFFHFFKSDVFGVDYSFVLTGGPFELYEILPPDVVQTLPIARQFDQVGPEELFRYGWIKEIQLRVLAFGTSIPFTVLFNDNTTANGSITVKNGFEETYTIPLPKGSSGEIVRIVLGPTAFNFHRYYVRIKCSKSGQMTDLAWVVLPDPNGTS